MLSLLLAAVLAAPPSVIVEGQVVRRFDAVGHLLGYNITDRADVYSETVTLPLATVNDDQDVFLQLAVGRYVRAVGRYGWWSVRPTLIVESLAAVDPEVATPPSVPVRVTGVRAEYAVGRAEPSARILLIHAEGIGYGTGYLSPVLVSRRTSLSDDGYLEYNLVATPAPDVDGAIAVDMPIDASGEFRHGPGTVVRGVRLFGSGNTKVEVSLP